jgi:broad specificity phosphatase PhoE
MTSVVLIRHAATAWSGSRYLGRTDLPLTPEGTDAARTMGAEIAATAPSAVRIVTSPSLRARQTAEIVAAAFAPDTSGMPVAIETDARWAEQDVGDAEGLTFTDVEARFPALARQLVAAETEIDWPSGEAARDFRARVSAAWTAVVTAGRPTIVVSHAGPIRLALALATGRPASEIEFPEPAQAVRLEISG